MRDRSHRRQVWLFLLAIVVPSVALAWIGARLIVQETELEEGRQLAERRRVVSVVRQALVSRLERIRLQEIGALASAGFTAPVRYRDPAVVLVALVSDNTLVLPWEVTSAGSDAGGRQANPRFETTIRRAEDAEFVAGDHAAAARLYRDAMELARDPGQVAHARLPLARVLAKAARPRESVAQYRVLLESDDRVVDEFGVPFALYAAHRLVALGRAGPEIALLIGSELDRSATPRLAALYLLRDLALALSTVDSDSAIPPQAEALAHTLEGRVAVVEHALQLQRDFPQLGMSRLPGLESREAEPVWLIHGGDWLVSSSQLSDEFQEVVVALRPVDVMTTVAREARLPSTVGSVAIVMNTGGPGESLLPNFPDLQIRFTATLAGLTAPWSLRRSFYLGALLLVLATTLMGGYLFWRDFRREVHVANLRSQFVSAVSHELKTPLTSIRMFAETLQMRDIDDADRRHEYLETIISESERLSRLLNNVLEFSKVEQGTKRYRPESTSLADIVRASARAMQYPCQQEGFTLAVEVADDIPLVAVDRDAIEQAILNLLTNAMKYSGSSRDIALRLTADGVNAVIEVSDRGVGIPEDEQRRIFEKFYRVPTSHVDGIPGTGLGLTLVRHIAEAHGGGVTVRSKTAQGSTFSIHLPLEASSS